MSTLPHPAPVIEARGLSKRYGATVAVDHLDLAVHAGEVFGMLGPNGSGKTTTILMLLGLTEPTAGEARVLGHDPVREPLEVKRRVGYMPDSVGFYDELTGRENLRYTARLNGLPRAEAEARIAEVLERMGIADVADRPVATYSRGMRQRLGLADVLLKRPQVAILDEPTIGLDPEAALEFLGLIRGLRADGITILLSSHLLHQVQAVCDRVGLFHRGRMVLEGRVEELSARVLGGAYRVRLATDGPDLEGVLAQVPGVVRVRRDGPGRYLLEAQRDCRAEAARRAVAAGAQLLELSLEQLGLDEVYARYFEEARDGRQH
ncbi:MAG: ABC transporter ATP-binding protein [Armatimonadota bacterium]|nr:ABC transporter ATP-binding protein [Armatimonadota bacterium]MDR7449395.1 ABC transporter ATP-binding protein [Armatimonadota bacterium]MDR7459807.1 ABC transporter ATP-binding protein [Armatimonadota bacterium]MDR7480263.1 ABC transporter ATP-binding protein [Armatimonadota bacterium]MDR7488698.1 ABC transporter ATP-binding protein [Armatimonadota bacterium]